MSVFGLALVSSNACWTGSGNPRKCRKRVFNSKEILTLMLSCCRVCSKHPQHGHHAGLLISDMLHWSSGSWRCYQLLLLGQLPRGRLRPKPSHSPRSPFSPTEELCCASNPTPGTSYLWPCTAKHTITVPARWVRRAALFGRTLWLRFGIEVSLHMAFVKKNKANTLQGFPSNLREAVCHCPLLGGNVYKPQHTILVSKSWTCELFSM